MNKTVWKICIYFESMRVFLCFSQLCYSSVKNVALNKGNLTGNFTMTYKICNYFKGRVQCFSIQVVINKGFLPKP